MMLKNNNNSALLLFCLVVSASFWTTCCWAAVEEGTERGTVVVNATTNTNLDNDDDGSDYYSYRSIYKGRFQLFADGCSIDDESPRLTALCAGDSIDLLVTSHPSIVCDPPQQKPADPGGSGSSGGGTFLSCYSTCSATAGDKCSKETYLNDGSYTTAEGPWGEIIYQCQGKTLGDVDSYFNFEGGTGSCQWQWFFDNELYHMAQLGILCDPYASSTPAFTPSSTTPPPPPQTTTDIDRNETTTINTTGLPEGAQQPEEEDAPPPPQSSSSSSLLSRVSIHNNYFVYDDYYLECSRGDSMMLDFQGASHDTRISCGIGKNCGGEDCDVDFDTITVHADVPHFAASCVQRLQPGIKFNQNEITSFQDIASAAPLIVSSPSSSTSTAQTPPTPPPAGNYTIQFRGGWSMLMKNPDYWYDNSDYEYYRDSDTLVHFKCANGGVIKLIGTGNPWIVCSQSGQDPSTLDCKVSIYGEEEMINAFHTITYNCTTSNKLPTTFAMYESNTMAVIEDVFDDLVVGHALQLGHYCSGSSNHDAPATTTTTTTSSIDDKTTTTKGDSDGGFRYQDYDYECGFPSDQYLLMDANTEVSGGDRFTCLETVPITFKAILVTMPPLGMRSEWRLEDGGAAGGLGLDPSCYYFQPSAAGADALP